MTEIYLVTVLDYETATIVGAYSTSEKADAVAAVTNVIEHGRFGPYVFPIAVDQEPPTPLWADGADPR